MVLVPIQTYTYNGHIGEKSVGSLQSNSKMLVTVCQTISYYLACTLLEVTGRIVSFMCIILVSHTHAI